MGFLTDYKKRRSQNFKRVMAAIANADRLAPGKVDIIIEGMEIEAGTDKRKRPFGRSIILRKGE